MAEAHDGSVIYDEKEYLMGIDSYTIFDISLAKEELMKLSENISNLNSQLSEIWDCSTSTFIWKLDIDDTDTPPIYELYNDSGKGFGFYSTGHLLSLWNCDRWKWLLRGEEGLLEKHLKTSRAIGSYLGAQRAIYISDLYAEDFRDMQDFNKVLAKIGKPYEINSNYRIEDDYYKIFFYEEFKNSES